MSDTLSSSPILSDALPGPTLTSNWLFGPETPRIAATRLLVRDMYEPRCTEHFRRDSSSYLTAGQEFFKATCPTPTLVSGMTRKSRVLHVRLSERRKAVGG